MPANLFDSMRPAQSPERDPSTLSNYYQFNVNKTTVDMDINWSKNVIAGKVLYNFNGNSELPEITLDTSYLEIFNVALNGIKVSFKLDEGRHPVLGTALHIPTNGLLNIKKSNDLEIDYSTTAQCTALQWPTVEQTAGKKAPYLYSQCEAIHARSLYPCFDTPSVKSPFDVTIKSAHPVVSTGVPVPSDEKEGVYKFVQKIPIPSYLLALASGDIASADIGPRSKVYTEPVNLDACKYEFENDTEKFIEAAEKIVFPYEWKTFNVLILPPSFPFGGMENPNITFATPTIVAGDRQNIDVIAHELAHSWSGNLVTNCSWEHFWLNEGWTVYLERRIMGAIHGERFRHFSAIIGWKSLEEDVERYKSNGLDHFTKLVVDLKDKSDPDDAFSTVPYDKGSTFLFHLETVLGGKEVFDPFIPYYFNKFKGKSLDTFQFRDTLYQFFPDKKHALDAVDWDLWLYGTGLPPKPDFDTSIADACWALASKWVDALIPGKTAADYAKEFSSQDIDGWLSTQAIVFLDRLGDLFEEKFKSGVITTQAAEALGSVYKFTESKNAEVVYRWYRVALNAHVVNQYKPLADWVSKVGRMKFVRPSYRYLNSVDRQLAVSTFKKNKLFYHPICQAMVTKDLGLE